MMVMNVHFFTFSQLFILSATLISTHAQNWNERCSIEVKVKRNSKAEVFLADSLKINCTVNYCDEKPTVGWCKVEELDDECIPVSETDLMEILWTGKEEKTGISSLHFKHIAMTDSGLYRCRCEGESGGCVSHAINVTVKGPCIPMTAVKENSVWSASPMGHLRVNCSVRYCSKRPIVSWCKVDNTGTCDPVNETDRIQTEWEHVVGNVGMSFLQITDITAGDAGVYRCALAETLDLVSVRINVTDGDPVLLSQPIYLILIPYISFGITIMIIFAILCCPMVGHFGGPKELGMEKPVQNRDFLTIVTYKTVTDLADEVP